MRLKCQRCRYEWNYQGQSEYYASCPRCKTNIRVFKKDEDDQKIHQNS